MVHFTEKQKNEEATRSGPISFTKLRIVKNIFILCFSFFTAFTAYDCLSMLQSTLNHKHGLGVVCQATVYGCYCISSLLLPKYVIKKFGCKWTLVLSMSLYMPYIASNLYPHWSFMVPTAALNGFSASFLWGAQSQYINETAAQYATQNIDGRTRQKSKTTRDEMTPEIKFIITDYNKYDKQNVTVDGNRDTSQPSAQKENANFVPNVDPPGNFSTRSADETSQKTVDKITAQKNIESTTARFFGIFGLGYLSTHMWSNLMSYFILQSSEVGSNITLNSSCVCGADFCNEKSDCFVHNLQQPNIDNRYLLIGICLALGLASIVIMALFLDPVDGRNRNVTFSLEFLFATGKQLKKINQILLTPISFYTGMLQGFYAGDFNLSFVGCAWGTSHVALVSACYGAACCVSSPVSGWLVKVTGRVPNITLAALVNVAAQVLMLFWKPTAEDPALFFVLSALWGTTVGILFSQVKAMYGILFKSNQEAAFGAYHVWYSLGFCLSFAYSNHLCTYVKIYALLSVLILGLVGYWGVELKLKIKK